MSYSQIHLRDEIIDEPRINAVSTSQGSGDHTVYVPDQRESAKTFPITFHDEAIGDAHHLHRVFLVTIWFFHA